MIKRNDSEIMVDFASCIQCGRGALEAPASRNYGQKELRRMSTQNRIKSEILLIFRLESSYVRVYENAF